jgi:hypothetical protein
LSPSSGSVKLDAWSQGGPLAGNKVQVPKIKSSRQGSDYFRQESDETERLPVEPDALFTLGFAAGKQGTGSASSLFLPSRPGHHEHHGHAEKLRACYHFIKKQQRHREAFRHSPDPGRAGGDYQRNPCAPVDGTRASPPPRWEDKRAGLFWFTISSLFVAQAPEAARDHKPAQYPGTPEVLPGPIWALPDGSSNPASAPKSKQNLNN